MFNNIFCLFEKTFERKINLKIFKLIIQKFSIENTLHLLLFTFNITFYSTSNDF